MFSQDYKKYHLEPLCSRNTFRFKANKFFKPSKSTQDRPNMAMSKVNFAKEDFGHYRKLQLQRRKDLLSHSHNGSTNLFQEYIIWLTKDWGF